MCQTYSLVVLAALSWFGCQISRRSQTVRVEPGSPFPKGDKEREVCLNRVFSKEAATKKIPPESKCG